MPTETHVDLHENCVLLLSDFNQNFNFSTYFSKTPSQKIYKNRFSGSRDLICRQTEREVKGKVLPRTGHEGPEGE